MLATEFVKNISILAGVIATLAGAFFGAKAILATARVNRLSLGLTSLEAALARADVERGACNDRIDKLEAAFNAEKEAHHADNLKCDHKIRLLGHIVKRLGGEVPDELNGLDD